MTPFKSTAPWGTITSYSASYAATGNAIYSLNGSVWQTLSPGSYTSVRKVKVQSGKAPIKFGWRDPTVFRAYAFGIIDNPAFNYKTSSAGRSHKASKSYVPNDNTHLISLFTSSAGIFPRTSANMVSRVQTECLNKLIDQEVNISESIATADQTIGMLSERIKQVAWAIRAARKGEYARVMQILTGNPKAKSARPSFGDRVDGVSSAWLEYQYGWKPLLNDIRFLINSLNNIEEDKLFITAKRHLTEEHPLPSKPSTGVSHWLCTGYLKSGAYCRIDATVKSPFWHLLNQVGLLNPALLAWELIPYSFVIDWLIPVGNVIQAFSASWTLRFKGGSMTEYTTGRVNYEWTAYTMVEGKPIRVSVGGLNTYRHTYGSMPLPRLYWKNPLHSLTRLATAIALLYQLRK